MAPEMSAKDLKMKAQMEKALKSPDQMWLGRFRALFSMLPSDPRCASCLAPFEGTGGAIMRTVLNRRRAKLNPLFCNVCEENARRIKAGVETEMSMLFADIRGSTRLAEHLPASEFRKLIDRFYTESTHVLVHRLAMIDKLAGDEVSGFFLPGYVGREHARTAVEAALEILRVTGHTHPDGPWVPVGVGINTGEAYFGTVGTSEDLVEITALGDAVNVAARLASQAGAGEVLMSESTVEKAGFNRSAFEKRALDLKGKRETQHVWVLQVTTSRGFSMSG